VAVQRHRWDIQIGAMVGTNDVLFFSIELFFIDDFERYADKDKHQFCPPPVKRTNQLEFFWKNDRDEEEEEENYKQEKEYDDAVKSVKAPDEFHAAGGLTYSWTGSRIFLTCVQFHGYSGGKLRNLNPAKNSL
jgi:hypothetical protein